MSDLEKNLIRGVLGVFLAIMGYFAIEFINLKGDLQEEIGRSQEIDNTHRQWLKFTSDRSLSNSERVTRLEARDRIHHQ